MHLTLHFYRNDTPRSKISCLPRGHSIDSKIAYKLQIKVPCSKVIASDDLEGFKKSGK